MVKTKTPILSLGASGALGGTVISQSWKGRSYLRKLTTPADPQSPTQVSTRTIFGFLTKQWEPLSAVDQATWNELAAELQISPFDAYLRENLIRWGRFQHPGQTYPVPGTGSSPTETIAGVINQGRGLLVNVLVILPRDAWGCTWHRGPAAPFLPAFDNCIGTSFIPGAGNISIFDYPLDPGTYWYKCYAFTTAGASDSTPPIAQMGVMP